MQETVSTRPPARAAGSPDWPEQALCAQSDPDVVPRGGRLGHARKGHLRPLPCAGALPGVRPRPPGTARRMGRPVGTRAPRSLAGGSGMSAPDQRAALAREYLAAVSRTGVDQLPPTVLAREVAELRRQLGQVLAVLAERQPEAPQQAAIAGPFATDREAHAAALQLGGPPARAGRSCRKPRTARCSRMCASRPGSASAPMTSAFSPGSQAGRMPPAP
jgi:hypothetical protein